MSCILEAQEEGKTGAGLHILKIQHTNYACGKHDTGTHNMNEDARKN